MPLLRLLNHQRVRLLVVLILSLASVYMLTYSARIGSNDELLLLDATGSFTRFGDFKQALSAGVRPPIPQGIPAGDPYPLPTVDAEPLQMLLAAPFYWLADRLPGVGLVHGVYLFNVAISALAGGLVYLYALALGYDERTGIAAGLLFGLGTILWPYSKTFFQEPLTLLLLLLTGLLLERGRAGSGRPLWLLAALLGFIAAILSKGAAVLALPGLLVIALPAWDTATGRRVTVRRALWVGAAVLALVVALVLLGDVLGVTGRIERLTNALGGQQPYAWEALHTYLLSIGGSFWGTSPLLLLAVPGGWWLLRQRRYRYPLAALLLLLAFAFVYAFRQGPDWFGGLSWPPRFLLPVLPFVMLCALPVLDRVLHGRASRLLLAGFALLVAYSLWWQFSGVSLWWADYANALPAESGHISEWSNGLNEVRYLRPFYIPPLWAQKPLDFAWVRLGLTVWALAFAALALACAYLLWRLLKGRAVHRLVPVALALVFVALGWAGLRAMYDDDLYLGFDDDLHALLPILAAQTVPGDVVLLSDLTYYKFFLNYGKLDAPRFVSLPDHPGEQPSPEQPPEITSMNPQMLLDWKAPPLIHALAQTRPRLWLLANNGPFISWSVRAAERFMHEYYFPAREFITSPDSRLLEYGTLRPADPYAFSNPAYLSDLVYDDTVHLAGYDLPAGTDYAPGEVLPVTLHWWAAAELDERYKVALLLRDADGLPAADALNTEPGGGFAPSDTWDVGVPVQDRRGLYLPEGLAPGVYQLWVVLYGQTPDGTVNNLPVTGRDTREGFIGILPTRIQIR